MPASPPMEPSPEPSIRPPGRPPVQRGRWIFLALAAAIWLAGVYFLVRMEHSWEGQTSKRIALGEKAMIGIDYGRLYGFWAGVVVAGGLLVAMLSSRWWWPVANPSPRPASSPPILPGRAEILVLLVLLLLSAWIRAPQLDRMVFRDEQDTLRYMIQGYHQVNKRTQELEFVPATWADAVFWNPHGNNPVLTSIASKASLDLWRAATGAPREVIHRVVFRLPLFFAGLFTILVLWWMARALLPPGGALVAAALGALHPEMINYGIEARGYGFMLLGSALALGAAFRALRQGDWRHWWLLGAGYWIMLTAYVGAAFFVLLTAGVIAAVLIRRWRKRLPGGGRDLARFLLAGFAAAAVFFLLETPALMCFATRDQAFPWKNELDGGWIFSFWTQHATGQMFADPWERLGKPPFLAYLFGKLFPAAPLYWTLALLIPPLSLLGLARAWRTQPRWLLALLLAVIVSPYAQMVTHFEIIDRVLFFFYLLYWLPVLFLLIAMGLEQLALWAGRALGRRKEGGGDASVPTGVFAALGFGFMGWFYAACTTPKPATSWAEVPTQTKPEIYTRGISNWIVYPTGETLVLRKEVPIPPFFPGAK